MKLNIDVSNEPTLLYLSIKDMIKLTDTQDKTTKFYLLRKLWKFIKFKLKELEETLTNSRLKSVEKYNINIKIAEDQLIDLKSELQENQDKTKGEELQDKRSLLEYYIYLWYKADYVITLSNVLDIIMSDRPDECKSSAMSIMLIKQAEYIVEMEKFNKNVNIYKLVLPNKIEEFNKEQKEIEEIYHLIVEAYKENVTYFEAQCTYKTKKYLSLTIEETEKLHKHEDTKKQLTWIIGLIDNYMIRYIRNKRNKLLNILISLDVVSYRDALNITGLQKKLKTYEKSDHKEKYILEYYIYLCSKYEYLNLLSYYILVLQPQHNTQQARIDATKKKSEEKFKQYQGAKDAFQKRLSKYLKFIKDNQHDKELKQCIPKKEEIEDIFDNLPKTDQSLLEKFWTEEEKQHKDELDKFKEEQKEQKDHKAAYVQLNSMSNITQASDRTNLKNDEQSVNDNLITSPNGISVILSNNYPFQGLKQAAQCTVGLKKSTQLITKEEVNQQSTTAVKKQQVIVKIIVSISFFTLLAIVTYIIFKNKQKSKLIQKQQPINTRKINIASK